MYQEKDVSDSIKVTIAQFMTAIMVSEKSWYNVVAKLQRFVRIFS